MVAVWRWSSVEPSIDFLAVWCGANIWLRSRRREDRR